MIVILGAFGRTGRAVAANLDRLTAGPLRLVARRPDRQRTVSGAEIAVAPLSDERALRCALRGARAVFALLPDDLHAHAFHAERRAMADTIASAIRQERIPRVVLLSSAAASLGEGAGNGLGSELAYLERLVCTTGAAVTVLRAAYFQENVVEAIPVAEGLGVYYHFAPSADVPFSTVSACDVGAFAARALLAGPQSTHEVVDLVGPAYSSARIAEILGSTLGKRLAVVGVGPEEREPLFRQWMSPEAARAMVETLACTVSGRALPRGLRLERAPTQLEQVLGAAVPRLRSEQELRP